MRVAVAPPVPMPVGVGVGAGAPVGLGWPNHPSQAAVSRQLGVLFATCLEMFGEQFDPLVEGVALSAPGYVRSLHMAWHGMAWHGAVRSRGAGVVQCSAASLVVCARVSSAAAVMRPD